MKDGKHVILVIDDDQDILDAARAVLESGGYTMVEAPSANEGRDIFDKEKPDLLIVDIMMEEIDAGIAFVEEIRGTGFEGPIYFLSSIGDELSKQISTSKLGVTGILQKPLKGELVLKLIDDQLK